MRVKLYQVVLGPSVEARMFGNDVIRKDQTFMLSNNAGKPPTFHTSLGMSGFFRTYCKYPSWKDPYDSVLADPDHFQKLFEATAYMRGAKP